MKTLALVPVDLSKLSGVVKNNAAKKTVHEKLVAKENNIDSGLVKKLDYNPKVTEIENKIPTISINCSGKYIPNISVLVKKKKTDYNTKNTEIEEKLIDHTHYKYITTPECKILTAEVLDARLARANLVTQTDFHTMLTTINQKITSNKTKKLLVENGLKKLKTFDKYSGMEFDLIDTVFNE